MNDLNKQIVLKSNYMYVLFILSQCFNSSFLFMYLFTHAFIKLHVVKIGQTRNYKAISQIKQNRIKQN